MKNPVCTHCLLSPLPLTFDTQADSPLSVSDNFSVGFIYACMPASATVEAMAESHSSKIDLGPFAFTQVKYKNSSGTWKNMDVKPTADSPFSVV